MTQKLIKVLQHIHTLVHIQTCTQSSLRQRCSDLEGELGTVRAGKEKVEVSLNDAQMELNNSRETLRNQTEQTGKLSKEVRVGEREGRKGRRGREGQGKHSHTQFFLQLEALKAELVRSAQERASEVEQYKAEVAAATLKHEEAKSSFDSQVNTLTTHAVNTITIHCT